jgi:hypothetical protein
MTALQDEKGCLTGAGFVALERAAVGRAPAELAAHLAACGRCQERMLARAEGLASPAQRERTAAPPVWRVWVVLAILIVMGALVVITAQRLLGR